MKYVNGLQCHLCKAKFPAQALWVCDQCLGPLEVIYDYDAVKRDMTREKIESRARNLRGEFAGGGRGTDLVARAVERDPVDR